jgi:hypothetical protein
LNQRKPIVAPIKAAQKLARTRQVEEVEIAGHVGPPEQVREPREGRSRNARESRRQPVESVGQVDGVAAPGDHHRHEEHVEHRREVDDEILEERQRCGRGRNGIGWNHWIVGQEQSEHDPEAHLPYQLPLGHQPARLPLHDLEVVVEEADAAHPEYGKHRHDYKAVGERRPQQRRHDGGEQDDEATHRWRPPLALVARGPLGADDLSHLPGTQSPDHRRPD